MAQAAEEKWQSPYIFAVDGVKIVMENHTELNLRSAPGKGAGALRSDGKFGKFARWTVNIKDENGNKLATFKNEKTEEYLRIHKDSLDCAGKGGKFCWFKIHRISLRVSKFESVEHPGKFVAINQAGDPTVGQGGKFCRIDCLKEGPPPTYTLPYKFKAVKSVVLEHRDSKFLRTSDSGAVNSNGGKGEWAQFVATPGDDNTVTFKNNKTGDYLRIHPNGDVDASGKGKGWCVFKYHQVGAKNEVRLESNKHDGKFLSLDPQNNTFVSDNGKNRKSIFNVFRDE